MKSILNYIFLLVFFLIVFSGKIIASNPYCSNLGFELKNFTNWTAYTWAEGQPGYTVSTPKVEGVVSGRHTIITSNGYDPVVGGTSLKLIPDGYNTSVKLGSTTLGAGGLRQSLTYTLDVTKDNAFVIYHFAVVLQDPYDASHLAIDEPRFTASIIDQNGVKINDCANYDVNASNAEVEGWNTMQYNKKPLYWRDWTAVGINLTDYIGQTVTLEFMTANCRRKGHFGYAYFVAECQPLYITVDYCSDDNDATLTAPVGFNTYNWKDSSGNTLGTNRSQSITNPGEGATFYCEMMSATGCKISLSSTINKFDPKAAFSTTPVLCKDSVYEIKFNNLSTTNQGTLSYTWDFGDGITSDDINPAHIFTKSGMHEVSLKVNNFPSTCFDVKTDSVETFYPPLIGITGDSTYCPGYTVTLKGYGADHYDWTYNGITYPSQDSVIVGAPGGTVAMIGYSRNGVCSTIKYCNVSEEPYWEFSATPDTLFCSGNEIILSAKGAVSYLWNTAETTSSIKINKPGIYSVTGTNPNGCQKTDTIKVTEIPLPNVDFVTSSATVDIRHNQLTCNITPQNGVQYSWDMGDGSVKTGNPVQHTYDISTTTFEYPVTLTATNNTGCTNSASKTIEVILFVPNVFTPNGDGYNDLFMTNYDLKIFDRQGITIYEGKDGWDGKYKGQQADNDTYFYLIKYTDKSQQTLTRKGYVLLKR